MEKVTEEGLLSINRMIELLKKYERFDELEYKVRRLKSELASGKANKESLERREDEMKEIEEKYIKPVNLVDERQKLVKQLLSRYERVSFH